MRILTTRVVNVRLDVPEGALREGDTVTLLVTEAEEPFSLTEDERRRLTASIAQADRGEGIDGWRLLEEL